MGFYPTQIHCTHPQVIKRMELHRTLHTSSPYLLAMKTVSVSLEQSQVPLFVENSYYFYAMLEPEFEHGYTFQVFHT